jgi:hypothetical protein
MVIESGNLFPNSYERERGGWMEAEREREREREKYGFLINLTLEQAKERDALLLKGEILYGRSKSCT